VGSTSEHRSGDERRRRRQHRLEERRSGFDRRRVYPVLGALRDNPWVLLAVLLVVNAMSLADGALTGIELSRGLATEANPVFGGLFGASPWLAAAFKVVVMLAVSILIWRWRRHRAILVVALVVLIAYAILLGYHIGSLAGIALR